MLERDEGVFAGSGRRGWIDLSTMKLWLDMVGLLGTMHDGFWTLN
jgi:hypothetical protein